MALFGLWKPKCPLDFREKGWIETRMRWLGQELGMNRLTRCHVVTPETEIDELLASCDEELQCQAEGILPEHDGLLAIPPGGRHWSFWTGGTA